MNLEEEIKRYRSGQMSAKEQHAFEKRALNDPLLAEALEGIDLITGAELELDLTDLSTRLDQQTKPKEILVAASAAPKAVRQIMAEPSKPKMWVWPMRIAATVVLLVASYFVFDLIKEDRQLTLQNEQPVTDSIDHKLTQPSNEGGELALVPGPKEETKDLSKQKAAKPDLSQDKPRAVASQPEEQKAGGAIDELVAEEIEQAPIVAQQEPVIEVEGARGELKARQIQPSVVTNSRTIEGTVISAEDQTPLPGVNIVIKGTTTGTVTDISGHYKLQSEGSNPVLVYSFIGLQSQEVTIQNQEKVNVQMQPDVSQLSEVVITGYSPTAKDPNHEPVVKLATPVGGLRAYDKYLKNSLKYPAQALENKIKGRVTVLFTVRTDGSLDEFNVVKGLGYGCDEEVIRLVKEGPRWSPTTEDEVPVESEVKVRVRFALPQ